MADFREDIRNKSILKYVHPNYTLTDEALDLVNYHIRNKEKIIISMINVFNPSVIDEQFLTSIITDILPGDLAKHANNEGMKSVKLYNEDKNKTSQQNRTRSQIVGLYLSVDRVENDMKSLSVSMTTDMAAIYITAVLEYLTAELLELGGIQAKNEDYITPEHINNAIRAHEELSELFSNIVA